MPIVFIAVIQNVKFKSKNKLLSIDYPYSLLPISYLSPNQLQMKLRFLFFLLLPLLLNAQSLEDKTKNLKAYKGFMNFYLDEKTGKIFLEINKLDTELLYQVSLPAGLGSNDIGLDRGLLGNTYIIKFSRVGNKVLMIEPNYNYRAITDNANEKRAVEQSFAQSTIYGFTVEAENNGTVLVDATNFLLRDAIQVANRIRNARQGNYSLDATRSALYLERTKNFPQNTEFESTVTFTNSDGQVGNYVSSTAAAGEAITLRIHHSFVQLPDNNYKPRAFDARSGFINTSYYDYSTPVTEPIEKFFIIRHRLQKKDPNAAISEAVKPIIYYLDNGTPEPIRSALMEGAQWWNQAFEAAGYKNAFQVKILPDDADPMDVRYNVINWVHRSTRGWSYGASVTDPRTGEIIKGHVTLGSLRVRQDYLIFTGLLAPFEKGVPADDKMLKAALQRLKQLAAHEVGHTLGLMHNYISSSQGNESVMDYPHPIVSLNAKGDITLDNAYTNEIGAWDKVSITYGYADFAPGTNESSALNKILTDASDKGLTFISDRDARDPAGAHPTTHLWDNGKDPVSNLKEVMAVRKKALSQFGLNNIRQGTPMAFLEDALVPVYLFHRYQTEAVTKVIGGLYYNYALKGDGQYVTKTVSKQEQINALNALLETMDPKTLLIPDNIVKLIPPRPAGYDYNRELFSRKTSWNFDPLSAAETAAHLPLSFLFNVARLNRMVQQKESYGGLGADEMINTLINATWKATKRSGTEALIQKQNQQLLLTYLLAASVNDRASFATKAVVLAALNELKQLAETKSKTNDADKGYYLLTLERMKAPEKASPTVHAAIPPGAPIGCYDEEFKMQN